MFNCIALIHVGAGAGAGASVHPWYGPNYVRCTLGVFPYDASTLGPSAHVPVCPERHIPEVSARVLFTGCVAGIGVHKLSAWNSVSLHAPSCGVSGRVSCYPPSRSRNSLSCVHLVAREHYSRVHSCSSAAVCRYARNVQPGLRSSRYTRWRDVLRSPSFQRRVIYVKSVIAADPSSRLGIARRQRHGLMQAAAF